jgi:hypothetical protein
MRGQIAAHGKSNIENMKIGRKIRTDGPTKPENQPVLGKFAWKHRLERESELADGMALPKPP